MRGIQSCPSVARWRPNQKARRRRACKQHPSKAWEVRAGPAGLRRAARARLIRLHIRRGHTTGRSMEAGETGAMIVDEWGTQGASRHGC